MGLWVTWSSGRCPCPWQGGWNEMIFKAPSNSNHSMILRCHESHHWVRGSCRDPVLGAAAPALRGSPSWELVLPYHTWEQECCLAVRELAHPWHGHMHLHWSRSGCASRHPHQGWSYAACAALLFSILASRILPMQSQLPQRRVWVGFSLPWNTWLSHICRYFKFFIHVTPELHLLLK